MKNFGKQIGGKIGIVKDPFGTPQYLGATTPIVSGAIDKLSLAADGKTLLGSVWLEEYGAPGSGYHSRFYHALLKWEVDTLIRAALETTDKTVPIDLIKNGNTYTPKLGVQPQKFDGALPADDAGNFTGFGWIYGITSGNQIKLAATTVRYGDIGEIDLVELIKARVPEFAHTSRADFSDFNLGDDSASRLHIVRKDATGPIVSREVGATGSTARASNELFTQTGILYVAADLDSKVQQLRNGERLRDDSGSFSVTVTIQGKSHTLLLAVSFTDYDLVDANGDGSTDNVFFGDRPLDNPGYSAFTLQGSVGVDSSNTNNLLDVWRVV